MWHESCRTVTHEPMVSYTNRSVVTWWEAQDRTQEWDRHTYIWFDMSHVVLSRTNEWCHAQIGVWSHDGRPRTWLRSGTDITTNDLTCAMLYRYTRVSNVTHIKESRLCHIIGALICVSKCHDSMTCVPWHVDICAMTRWYGGHDALTCMPWFSDIYTMTHWYVCHD